MILNFKLIWKVFKILLKLKGFLIYLSDIKDHILKDLKMNWKWVSH